MYQTENVLNGVSAGNIKNDRLTYIPLFKHNIMKPCHLTQKDTYYKILIYCIFKTLTYWDIVLLEADNPILSLPAFHLKLKQEECLQMIY